MPAAIFQDVSFACTTQSPASRCIPMPLPLQVVEEAEHGKLYVRGHDREGRPIIHYSPGLEISFDTEKVRQRCTSLINMVPLSLACCYCGAQVPGAKLCCACFFLSIRDASVHFCSLFCDRGGLGF